MKFHINRFKLEDFEEIVFSTKVPKRVGLIRNMKSQLAKPQPVNVLK